MNTLEQKIFDYDLVIVGGGIVGATLAVSLKDSGLSIGFIESQTFQESLHRHQAYALSIMSGQIFQGLKIWDDIFPHIGKFRHIRLSDADYPNIIHFKTDDVKTDYLGYVGEHRVILSALHQQILTSNNITPITPAKVLAVSWKDDSAELILDQNQEKKTLKTRLVIGADGAKSNIRQWGNIKTKGWKYWQSCVAFTVKHTAPRNDIAFERFWYSGPMGILPLPDNCCQIVWTAPHQQAHDLLALDEERFLQELLQRTGGVLGEELTLVKERRLFPVQLMQCDSYVKSRLALIGDAAHCCHPLGGQGLNLGIRDAVALGEVLKMAFMGGEDIGHLTVLSRYQDWRKQENLTILGMTDLLDRLFSNSIFPIVFIRRMGLWLLQYFKPLKVFSLQLMTGLLGRKPMIVNQ